MKKSKIALGLYIVAAITCLLFLYMLISSVTYLSAYAGQYGMTVGDMGSEAYQYIITNAAPYLVYTALLVAAAQILTAVQGCKCECECEGECSCECSCECEAPAQAPLEEVVEAVEAPVEEAWSMDKVPPLYTSKSFMNH